jgi:ABC-type dipeptide/oligopeptide/nickel transport system permease component
VGAIVIAVSGVSWVLLFRGVFAAQLEWFPVLAWDPPSLGSLLLPISIWAFLAAWPDHQIYRRILINESQATHVLAARARGLAPRELWLRHILRSGSAALLAHFVLALPFLVLGSLILEQIFVVPGLGAYLVDAARNADAAVLRAATFLLALIYLIAQETGDWLSGRLDPRFRRAGGPL